MRMPFDLLSEGAQEAVRESWARQRHAAWCMKQGPWLTSDHTRVVVPSESGYFREDGRAFWRARGFHWERGLGWVRCIPRQSRWPVEKWLEAARRAYAEFWPNWTPPAPEEGAPEEQERRQGIKIEIC